MFRYTLSKISLLGIVLFLIGGFFTVQGILIRTHLSAAPSSYEKTEIRNGCFLDCELTRDQLVGSYYTEMNGALEYSPYVGVDAVTSTETYLCAINKNMNYYVPLIVTRDYVPPLTEMIDYDGTYHLFGKFEKNTRVLTETDYKIITEATGAADKEAVDQMVSTKYQIKVTDFKKEQTVLYKGLSLLVIGVLAVLGGIGKEKVIDELEPHRQPWDLI